MTGWMPDVESAVDEAVRLLLARPPALGKVRLGVVDGPSGSGKSTFARDWVEALHRTGCRSVMLFSSDLLATWTDPFGWWPGFDEGVLHPLQGGSAGRIRLSDWSAGDPRPGSWLSVPTAEVLILEGVSCGRRALAGRASVLVWLTGPDRTARLERAVGRDGESSRALLAAWQDDEDAFFRDDRAFQRADLAVGTSTS